MYIAARVNPSRVDRREEHFNHRSSLHQVELFSGTLYYVEYCILWMNIEIFTKQKLMLSDKIFQNLR